MLRFVNEQFIRLMDVKDGFVVKPAKFITGKAERTPSIAALFSRGIENVKENYNDGTLSLFSEATKIPGANKITLLSGSEKRNYDKHVVIIALPFVGHADTDAVKALSEAGVHIHSALVVKTEGKKKIVYNNRRYDKILYLVVEVDRKLSEAETYEAAFNVRFSTKVKEHKGEFKPEGETKPINTIEYSQIIATITIKNDAISLEYSKGRVQWKIGKNKKTLEQSVSIGVTQPKPKAKLEFSNK